MGDINSFKVKHTFFETLHSQLKLFLQGFFSLALATSCPWYSNEDKHQKEEIFNCPQCSIWKKTFKLL